MSTAGSECFCCSSFNAVSRSLPSQGGGPTKRTCLAAFVSSSGNLFFFYPNPLPSLLPILLSSAAFDFLNFCCRFSHYYEWIGWMDGWMDWLDRTMRRQAGEIIITRQEQRRDFWSLTLIFGCHISAAASWKHFSMIFRFVFAFLLRVICIIVYSVCLSLLQHALPQ